MTRSKIKPAIPEHHPIAKAVAPLRAAAVKAVTEHAERYLAQVKARIEAEPNIKVLAPYPNAMGPEYKYHADRAWRAVVSKLSRSVPGQEYDYSNNRPELIEYNPEGAAAYIAEQQAHAEHNYIAFVLKLIAKVEASGSATLTASIAGTDDAWTQSELTVSLADGTQSVWRTKQIWNTSIYGKVFAQYPTRVVKPKAAKKAA